MWYKNEFCLTKDLCYNEKCYPYYNKLIPYSDHTERERERGQRDVNYTSSLSFKITFSYSLAKQL